MSSSSCSLAFTPRLCTTGEYTGDTLGSICAVTGGSLIDPFVVSASPPPFGEAVRMPFTPPPVGTWLPDVCVVLEGLYDDRPTAGCTQSCTFYYATDTEELYYDDCTEEQWILVNPCVVLEDEIANRPEPCTQSCKLFYATDEEILYFDDCENNKWVPLNGGVFDEDTALEIGECGDSADMSEDKDSPTDCEELAWDINDQDPEEEGVIIDMLTRIIYQVEDDGGSEILYGFCRTFGFDTAGRLVAVSEECTRSIIDTPEACTTE